MEFRPRDWAQLIEKHDREIAALLAQRDELLAALEGICDAADSDKGLREHLGGDLLDAARAAIANARGGA